MIFTMRYVLLLIIVAAALAGCSRPAASTSNASANAASPNAKRYAFKGVVTAVDKTAKTATIKHDAIEGYMDAMTMAFPIHADWVWDELNVGSEVRADLVVDPQSEIGRAHV